MLFITYVPRFICTHGYRVESVALEARWQCVQKKWLVLIKTELFFPVFSTKLHVCLYTWHTVPPIRLLTEQFVFAEMDSQEQACTNIKCCHAEAYKAMASSSVTPNVSRHAVHGSDCCHTHIIWCSSLWLINSFMDSLAFHLSLSTRHSLQFYGEIHAGWISASCQPEQSDLREYLCQASCLPIFFLSR